MTAFIIICVVVFVIVVICLNFQRIKNLFAKKDKTPKEKEEKPKKIEKSSKDTGLSYVEEDYSSKKVDNIKRETKSNNVKYEVEDFVKATEQELKELEAKKENKGGRLHGAIKSIDNIDVVVEDLKDEDDFDSDENFDDFDMFEDNSNKSISKQIQNLPPELKALIVSDVLKRKDD